MASKTNATSFAVAEETSIGVLPGGSPVWTYIEPNDVGAFGARIQKVARDPISQDRQNKKGNITDVDSSVEWTGDLTMDHFLRFAESFVYANFSGIVSFVPTAATEDAGGDYYTVSSGGNLTAGWLVYARGFSISKNNGLKRVASGATSTNLKVEEDLDDETPPSNAEIRVCGVQGASGDIEIDGDGNLTSTALDFTTLGLTVGQFIFVGDTENAVYQFATANQTTNVNWGLARVLAIAANKLTLDKKGGTWTTDAGTGKTIRILYGPFLRNVPVSDGDFIQKSFTFEAAFDGLDDGGGGTQTEYEYAKGNVANQLELTFPLADKAGMNFSFIGLDTDPPTATRKAGNWKNPLLVEAVNTTNDFARLRITKVDETGISTSFKSLTLTINNNATAEKVIGTLGAVDIPYGNFEVKGSTEVVFEDSDVIAAVRQNTTVAMDMVIFNDDGGVAIDIPAMTLGDSGKNLERNTTVKLQIESDAFKDPTLGYSVGMTYFPYIPE